MNEHDKDYWVAIGKRLALNEIDREAQWLESLVESGTPLTGNPVTLLRNRIAEAHRATDQAVGL